MEEDRFSKMIRMPVLEVDYLEISVGPNFSRIEFKWLRPVTKEEYRQGLALADRFYRQIRAEVQSGTQQIRRAGL